MFNPFKHRDDSVYNRDAQNYLAGEFFKILLPLLFIVVVLSSIASIYPVFMPSRFSITVSNFIAIILGGYLYRKKRNREALFIIIAFGAVALFIGVFINGGVRAPGYVGLLVVLSFIAWVYSSRVVITFVFIKILIGGIVVYLDSKNLLIVRETLPDFNYYIFYTVYDLLIATTLIAGNRLMHEFFQSSTDKENFIISIFNSINDAIILIGNNNKILRTNDSGKEFIYEYSEKPKIHFLEIVFEDNAGALISLEDIIKKESVDKILKFKLNREITWLSFSVRNLQHENRLIGKLIVIKDISENKRTEMQLIQSQKMDAVGQLASGIAHDFNNALSGIVGVVDLFSIDANDDQLDILRIAESAVEKASGLTKQLLLFSRKNVPSSTAISIGTIVKDTVFLLKRSLDKNIIIEEKYLTADDTVVGDDSQIQSAIMNLAINASHAMPDGGKIIFEVDNSNLDQETCNKCQFDIEPGKYVKISVEDTGTGIDRNIITKIFDPFFTTKEEGKGTGLGLAAVAEMVKKHSGCLKIDSEVGVGTTFTLYLPFCVVENEAEKTKVDTKLGVGTILVVDDEEIVRITTSEMLRSIGYEVLLAKNGKEALHVLSKNSVDLVVLDMIMPVMNGKEAFNEMHKLYPKLPVILSSGFSKEEDLLAVREKGLFGFIQKPFRRAELSDLVHKGITGS